MYGSLFDMSDRVLNAAGEAVLRDRLTALCSLYSSLGGFLDAGLFKSRYLDYLAAELA